MLPRFRSGIFGVTISSIGAAAITTTASPLTVLAQASANATTQNANIEINEVDNQIQKRLAQQTAALQAAPDSGMTAPLQAQLSSLQNQSSVMAATASSYGANANTIFDLQNQLATLQTEAASGNSAGFDATLATANADVYDLGVVNLIPPMQPDGVATLKANGLGIGASGVYDLSTPSGQAAAEAAIQNAQTVVAQVSQVTTSNQLIASSVNSSLTTQINSLNSQLQQVQQNTDTQTTNQIAQLTQQAQEQEHLFELAIGNTQLVSTALLQAESPPQPTTSPLEALSNAVGATVSSYQAQQSSPAILSLLT